jgi:KaiC/GvpD/RAD55 family RecA-like ATPase
VLGFGLSQEEAFRVMADWNQACQPPWSEKELRHKLADAEKQPGERNYLRDAPRENDATTSDGAAANAFSSRATAPNSTLMSNATAISGATGGDRIKQLGGPPVSSTANVVPEGSAPFDFVSPPGEEHWRPKAAARGTQQLQSAAAGVTPQVPFAPATVPPLPKVTVPVAPLWRPSRTLVQSARDYLAAFKAGNTNLMSLGLPAVDFAIGGGVERSEVIIIGARPSHGKTCVGLQAAYTAAAAGRPVLIISEEMSPLALGKRAIQFACDVPEEHWRHRERDVLAQLERHFATQAPIHVVDSCGTVERAADAIRRHVEAGGVQCVVVDYGQLLGSRGGNRYEQMSRTSITLRQLANELKITMIVLAQLNRAIETRDKFIPRLSDLRDAGQWEQDADVILFLLWPHRLDPKHNRHEYFIFIAKNRNRPTHATSVKCQFEPARQRLLLNATTPSEADVDEWCERYREF